MTPLCPEQLGLHPIDLELVLFLKYLNPSCGCSSDTLQLGIFPLTELNKSLCAGREKI
jgi:hypothetical protein